MDIKLGIADVAREITLDTDMTSEDIADALQAALAVGGVLEITDKNGRTVLVPAARVGYVELGSSTVRPVGFGQV